VRRLENTCTSFSTKSEENDDRFKISWLEVYFPVFLAFPFREKQ